ncbi:MAG: hypothetical protein JST80_08205 [Bdellovibrionales bacterium]|nr:hypothetical protein [Bdellovibrionales bacterium]
MLLTAPAMAGAINGSTGEVKKKAENDIRGLVQPVLDQYCHDQCKIIHIESEVDIAVDDEVAPGFEEEIGKVALAPASGKIRLLIDEGMAVGTRNKILTLLKEHLDTLDYSVQIDTKVTKFPNPVASGYRVADLREKVAKDIRASMQSFLGQFCPEHCVIGEFDVQTEAVNPEDVDYSSSQDYFQDGPAAVRVRGVKATIVVDQQLPAEESNSIVEMARMKLGQYKNVQVTGQVMKFPKPVNADMLAEGAADGVGGKAYSKAFNSKESKEAKEARELKESRENTNNNTATDKHTTTSTATDARNENKQEKFERYEKIERVENGDAVQAYLDKFRMYGIILSAIILALLTTLVAISFRKHVWGGAKDGDYPKFDHAPAPSTNTGGEGLTSDEKATLIVRRVEADRLYDELVGIYSEQPKVAKHVFTHVLTEEGVETTAQYLEIFGESVVMDLMRDPGLQSDCTELMDFFARNTFDINEDERLSLLKKLHHRTVTAKMQVHGSRSATLFDFLAEMDAPQITEMVKNESNTVKAIVLTQCDQKKRNTIFNAHDDGTKMKLMTELSRIDHLPKNYIFNVATALRRKKAENPKLNTEALPGTDVLVTFLEKATIDTQRTIIHQLMSSSGADALNNLKTKLVSLETLRFIKDIQLTEVITHIKHDEIVQFLKGCNAEVRESVLSKAPQDLSAELSDELQLAEPVSRETYAAVERKVINRIKVLANQGAINLSEVNERMFAEEFGFNHQNTSEISVADLTRKVG